MSTVGTARNACAGSGAFLYQCHRPEKTLLHQLVSRYYPACRQKLAEEGRVLPGYVQREFDWIGRCEEAMLGVSTGFSQISGIPRAERHRQFLSLSGGLVKLGY
jgi:hypothetical protein